MWVSAEQGNSVVGYKNLSFRFGGTLVVSYIQQYVSRALLGQVQRFRTARKGTKDSLR